MLPHFEVTEIVKCLNFLKKLPCLLIAFLNITGSKERLFFPTSMISFSLGKL